MSDYCVYMLSNRSKTLYTGVTNDLDRRVAEHKGKTRPGFTKKYNLTKLVYSERFMCVKDAISREKQIKGWNRDKKIKLIESVNPGWKDISIG